MSSEKTPLSQLVDARFGQFPYSALRRGLGSMTRFGRALAGCLRPGDILAMVGELGAGKSNLVRLLVDEMTYDYPFFVSSPSYTIANIYPTLPCVAHLDLYRLKTDDDFYSLGCEEYFAENTITLVEWADILPAVIPAGALWLGLKKTAPTDRRVIMAGSFNELSLLMD